jgi:hypothetical protein
MSIYSILAVHVCYHTIKHIPELYCILKQNRLTNCKEKAAPEQKN